MHGSDNICSASISGNCSFTMSVYFREVTTQILRTSIELRKRSTVNCNRLFPIPSISRNCLGYSGVLIGQKRLPIPPAIITSWLSLSIISKSIVHVVVFQELGTLKMIHITLLVRIHNALEISYFLKALFIHPGIQCSEHLFYDLCPILVNR